jgi:hypothetical protein
MSDAPDPFVADWDAWPERDAFIADVGDPSLAFRLYVLVGPDARAWLDRPIPALGDAKPRSLLESRAGRRELRRLAARGPR